MTDPRRDKKTLGRHIAPLASFFGRLTQTTGRIIVICLLMIVRAYQLMISPFTKPRCRFQPTCSEYARQALEEHGLAQGLWLTAKRLGRCHPFSDGGVDLVPTPHTEMPSRVSNKP